MTRRCGCTAEAVGAVVGLPEGTVKIRRAAARGLRAAPGADPGAVAAALAAEGLVPPDGADQAGPLRLVALDGADATALAARLMDPEGGDRLALHRARQAHARHGICEAFDGRMRDELLNETLFRSLDHARGAVARRVADDNHERPHSAFGYAAPATFAAKLAAATTAGAQPAQTRQTTPEAPVARG